MLEKKPKSIFGPCLLIIGISIFGFSDSLTLIISDTASVGQFHFLRSLAVMLMILFLGKIFGLSVVPKRWGLVMIRTGFVVTAIGLYFSVMPMMSMAEAGAGLFTSPIFVFVFSAIFLKERIGLGQIVALILAILGIFLIFLPKLDHLSMYHFFPVIAGAMYAISSIMTFRFLGEESPLALIMAFVVGLGLYGLIVVTIFSIFPVSTEMLEHAPFIFKPWTSVQVDYLVWIGVIALCTTAALTLMTKAYQIAKTSQVAIYEYSYVISLVVSNYLIWSDLPTSIGLMGITAIILAGVVLNFSKHQQKQEKRL